MDLSASDIPQFSVAAVARDTAVPAVTLRAWERRYGFPRPVRLSGGRRLYTQRDIWTVQDLRRQTERGVPISRAIALWRERAAPTTDEQPPGRHSPLTRLTDHLLTALLDLKAGLAEQVLSEALSLLSVEDACLNLMQPVLNQIGQLWQDGQATITQEHFASAIVRARLSSLLQHALAGADRPMLVAACPAGEWHELGLLMTCLFLARRGYPATYLGPNLPTADLVRLVEERAPRLVLLSAHTDLAVEQLTDVLRDLQRLPTVRPWLAYGGSIFNQQPALRSTLPAIFLGPDALAATATVERLLTSAGPRAQDG